MVKQQGNLPKVSDAEWEVMKVVWESSPITANDVSDKLAARHKWSPRTVKTMLNRLVKKGALDFEAQGKRYLYRPKVTQEECVRSESQSFLSRVFDGQAAEILLYYARNAKLSSGDIQELKRILEEKEEG